VISEGTLAGFYEKAQRLFAESGFSEPEVEARGILAVGMNMTSTEIYTLMQEPMT
jgi:hypothetical protein